MELTTLAFLKKVVEVNEVDSQKQSEYLIYYLLIAFVQLGFIFCMLAAITGHH